MKIVGSNNGSNPGEVARARSLRAVGSRPLILTVKALVADTVLVILAGAVTGAGVLAITTLAVAVLLVPYNLAPRLRNKGRSRGWNRGLCVLTKVYKKKPYVEAEDDFYLEDDEAAFAQLDQHMANEDEYLLLDD